MDSIAQQYQFVGPSQTRARPVLAEDWERHYDLLRTLYVEQDLPLRKVMRMMEMDVGFAPSAKQYRNQFKRWNFQKRATHADRKVDPHAQSSSPSSKGESQSPSESESAAHSRAKRAMSRHSSVYAMGENGLQSAHKRQRIYSGRLDPGEVCLQDIGGDGDVEAEGDSSDIEVDPTDFDDWAPPSSLATKEVTIVDLNRDVGSAPWAELHKVKQAADLLAVLGLGQQAFPLYNAISKQLENTADCPDWMRTWVAIACARNAVGLDHRAQARDLLERRQSSLPDSFERRIVTMLLRTDIFLFQSSNALETLISDARPFTFDSTGLSTYLLAFSYLQRYNDMVDGSNPVGGEELNASRRLLMEAVPGPLELNGDRLGNQAIKSCLEWCKALLCDAQVGPFMASTDSNQDAAVSAKLEQNVEWLFCFLWEQWQLTSNNDDTKRQVWTMQIEKRLGISGCEFLWIITKMLLNGTHLGLDSEKMGSRGVLRSALHRARFLLHQSDACLVDDFLKQSTSVVLPFNTPRSPTAMTGSQYSGKLIKSVLRLNIIPIRAGETTRPHSVAHHFTPQAEPSRSQVLAPTPRSSMSASFRSFKKLHREGSLRESLARNSFETRSSGSVGRYSMISESWLSAAFRNSLSLSSSSG